MSLNPSLKMSNFKQTIAVHKCVLLLTGGLRCPDPSNATRALFCLVALCVLRMS